MLGLGRNTPTRGERISSELGECRGHLREAASLIAGGAAERLNPRVEHAKEMMSPKMDKAREAALHRLEGLTVALGGQPHKARWPMLAGALGIGVIAGAVGALLMQRRNSRWDEYEPVRVLGVEEPLEKAKDVLHETTDKVRDVTAGAKATAKQATESVADTVSSGVKKLRNEAR